jgi:hypothetical protein
MLLLAATVTLAMGRDILANEGARAAANSQAQSSQSKTTSASEESLGIRQPRYVVPSGDESGKIVNSNTAAASQEELPNPTGVTTASGATTVSKVEQASWTSVWRRLFDKEEEAEQPEPKKQAPPKPLPQVAAPVKVAAAEGKARPPVRPDPNQLAISRTDSEVAAKVERQASGDQPARTPDSSEEAVEASPAATASADETASPGETVRPLDAVEETSPGKTALAWSKLKSAVSFQAPQRVATALGRPLTTMRNNELLPEEPAGSSTNGLTSPGPERKRAWDDSPLLQPFKVSNSGSTSPTSSGSFAAGVPSAHAAPGVSDSAGMNALAGQLTMSTTDDWQPLSESVDDSMLSDDAYAERRWTDIFPSMSNPFSVVQGPVEATAGAGWTRLAAYQETLPEPPSQDVDDAFKDDPNQENGGSGQGGKESKTLADAEKLGEEPEDNTLQFLRTQTVLLEPGESQFDIGINYLFSENDFPILLLNGGVPVGTDDVLFRIRELTFPLEYRVGLLKRVQGFIGAPIGWSNTQVAVGDYEQFENDGGFGDLDFGATIQLIDGNAECPHGLLTISATAPTGGDPFGPAPVLAQSSPSLGQGFWSISGNALCVQTYDPLAFFYGVGVEHFFARHFNGVEFEPGNSWNYTFGVGFAVNDRVTLSTRFLGSYVEEVRINRHRVFGTNIEPMTIRMAATISKPCDRLVEPFVEFGITDSAVESFFGITWTY